MAEVNIEDLKPNSHKYKEEQKESGKVTKSREKVSPVIKKDQVISTKKPLSKKILEIFVGDDVKDIKTWLIQDKIIPGVKHIILDTASMMFFGEVLNRYDDYRYGRSSYGKTNYGSYYGKSSSSRRADSNRRDRGSYYEKDDKVDPRNIVVRNRQAAEDVVEELRDRIRKYDSVSVADLLNIVDLPSQYTDNNWGWTNDRDIGIRRVANGFLIDVSEPRYLD